jgi:hypothetical protein
MYDGGYAHLNERQGRHCIIGVNFLSPQKIASHPQLYSKFIKEAYADERFFSFPNEHYSYSNLPDGLGN